MTGSCRTTRGIVAGVMSFLLENNCTLLSLQQYNDAEKKRFFIRSVFHPQKQFAKTAFRPGQLSDIEKLRENFKPVAEQFKMEWSIDDPQIPFKVLIMVTKANHCLREILYRRRTGELPIEITAIVSNHDDLRTEAEDAGVRYVHFPVNASTKAGQEKRLLELVDETGSELIVLARYMQILSPGLAKKLSGRCINIHHSFLPAFKGAKPYHQAHSRGVKLIGATAHYVTEDLDDGPIIEQQITRVDHNHTADDLARVGMENERAALIKAVKYHIEHRAFLSENRTIIFY